MEINDTATGLVGPHSAEDNRVIRDVALAQLCRESRAPAEPLDPAFYKQVAEARIAELHERVRSLGGVVEAAAAAVSTNQTAVNHIEHALSPLTTNYIQSELRILSIKSQNLVEQ